MMMIFFLSSFLFCFNRIMITMSEDGKNDINETRIKMVICVCCVALRNLVLAFSFHLYSNINIPQIILYLVVVVVAVVVVVGSMCK